MLLELVNISATTYFRIRDSELYGGPGSEGFSAQKIDGIQNMQAISEGFVKEQMQLTAKVCGVPIENVEVISQEEFRDATGEDE